MICPRCRESLYRDEQLEYLQTPEGNWQLCPRCVAHFTGLAAPARRSYPPGFVPPGLIVCGVCRRALRAGDGGQHVRLAWDDVAGTNLEPGGYAACVECVTHFAPAVRDRLIREGRLREDTPVESLIGAGSRALS